MSDPTPPPKPPSVEVRIADEIVSKLRFMARFDCMDNLLSLEHHIGWQAAELLTTTAQHVAVLREALADMHRAAKDRWRSLPTHTFEKKSLNKATEALKLTEPGK